MRQRLSILFSVSLWLLATAAQAVSFGLDAIPAGPITSGNGNLQLSNFQFFSPFDSVDAGDVTLTTLDDGIQLSGPISVTRSGTKTFLVVYQVTPQLTGGIDGASLLLVFKVRMSLSSAIAASSTTSTSDARDESFKEAVREETAEGRA